MPELPKHSVYVPTPLSTDTCTPLVSIIMPAYNAERFIRQAIESVIAQHYQHWELIVIDDASSDQTAAMVHQIQDPRIQLHSVTRIGYPAGVRNAGLRLAKGEFIAFLDADDCFYPNTLNKLLKPLLNNPQHSAVYGFAREVNEQGDPIPQLLTLTPKDPEQVGTDDPAHSLPQYYNHSWYSIVTGQISCVLPGLLLRKTMLEKVGLLNDNLKNTEDYEFYVRLFLDDYLGIYCLSDYVYQYRIHGGSLTKTTDHCHSLLRHALSIKEWLFQQPQLPSFVQAYRSKAFMDCYRYLARERLVHNQGHLAQKILIQGFQDRNICLSDALTYFAPLLLRTCLPLSLNHWLIQLRLKLKSPLNFMTLLKFKKAEMLS
jgi:glycosyltransferase involved in cell wall biosynthesis